MSSAAGAAGAGAGAGAGEKAVPAVTDAALAEALGPLPPRGSPPTGAAGSHLSVAGAQAVGMGRGLRTRPAICEMSPERWPVATVAESIAAWRSEGSGYERGHPLIEGATTRSWCEAVIGRSMTACEALDGLPDADPGEFCRHGFVFDEFLLRRHVLEQQPMHLLLTVVEKLPLPPEDVVIFHAFGRAWAEGDETVCTARELSAWGDASTVCRSVARRDPEMCGQLSDQGQEEMCQAFHELPPLLRAGQVGLWRHRRHNLFHRFVLRALLMAPSTFDCTEAARYAIRFACGLPQDEP